MNRLVMWGNTLWPGRWQRVMATNEFNLLPWRRTRQWLEWGALALGLVLGLVLGSAVGWLIEWQHQDELEQLQAQSLALRLEVQAGRERLTAWQQRWAWQNQQDAREAQRAEALRGLLQPLKAPPGEVLMRAMSWDGQVAKAELWVVHPDQASPWLQQHWRPQPNSQWHSVGEWQAVRRDAGTLGQAGATVWQGRWQSQEPASRKGPSS